MVVSAKGSILRARNDKSNSDLSFRAQRVRSAASSTTHHSTTHDSRNNEVNDNASRTRAECRGLVGAEGFRQVFRKCLEGGAPTPDRRLFANRCSATFPSFSRTCAHRPGTASEGRGDRPSRGIPCSLSGTG